MSKRGQSRQQRQRENEYIDEIQSEYLTHRFNRIIAILSKHYVYSLQLMINLNSLYPSSFHRKVEKITFILQSIRFRYTKNVFGYFIRKLQRRQQSKQKACLMILELLQRPIIVTQNLFFVSLTYFGTVRKPISKDKQLFLIIACSNIAKTFNSTKIQAFQAIKYTSRQSRITYNKAKIITLEYVISKTIDRSLQKAFNKMKLIRQKTYFLNEDEQNDGESDQQNIMIQSYKSLAFNLRKMKDKQKAGRDIIQAKRQEAVKNLYAVLDEVVRIKMKWTLWELNWNCRREYTPQTYQILARQIAVLEKEYQSN